MLSRIRSAHHAIILSRAEFIFFKLNYFSDFLNRNALEDLFGCSAKHIYLVAKDKKRKEIVMEQLSLRQIEKKEETMIDRSEKVDGAKEIISMEPSLLSPLLNRETGLFIIEINTIKM